VKILLSSYVFSPGVGGIETVSALLAPEFVRAGHEVILITHTAEPDSRGWPFRVVRQPEPPELMRLVRWCDLYFQNNISLTYAWPLLFIRRPWIVAHHTWLGAAPGRHGAKARLKRLLLRHATNAAISPAIAADLPVPSTLVDNPFAASLFHPRPDIRRDREIAFLGRLVSDKGADLLLEALVLLRTRGLRPRLTFIGAGPAQGALEQLVRKSELEPQVHFAGGRSPDEAARFLNAHQILAVPSRWPEPFGLVALEGIASGCAVVAAASGSLPEAVGPGGLTFTSGDAPALAAALAQLLTQPELRARLQENAPAHLRRFAPETVAANYLRLFERALASAAPAAP
jgi:glycosyltransferase involved in cell wall biosynthesis